MMLAYVDPGLGALVWQIVVSGGIGLLFYVKKTRRWLVGIFQNIFLLIARPFRHPGNQDRKSTGQTVNGYKDIQTGSEY
jgi:hypothetical protein